MSVRGKVETPVAPAPHKYDEHLHRARHENLSPPGNCHFPQRGVLQNVAPSTTPPTLL